MYNKNAVENAIHHYVAVKGYRCAQDLEIEERISLIKDAYLCDLLDGSPIYDQFTPDTVEKVLNEVEPNPHLYHAVMTRLYDLLRGHFDDLFDHYFDIDCFGDENPIGVSLGNTDYDPISQDQKYLAREINYHNQMFKSLFNI